MCKERLTRGSVNSVKGTAKKFKCSKRTLNQTVLQSPNNLHHKATSGLLALLFGMQKSIKDIILLPFAFSSSLARNDCVEAGYLLQTLFSGFPAISF